LTLSFEATKLLSLLVYPLSQALLLCFLALVLVYLDLRRLALVSLGFAVAWLYLASTGIVADRLMASLEKDQRPRALSVIPQADVIVVLGGATRGDTHWSSLGDLTAQADRLVHATQLFKAGKAPRVLVSGGAPRGARSEAELMEQLLAVMGVPRRAVLRESESRDTHDNARFSGILLRGKGLERILLVTSAFHMRRAKALFLAEGLDVIPAPTDFQRLVSKPPVPRWLPTVQDLQRSTLALREHVGYWVYRWRGWI
jgi:uncharacterized SAM-binding protein YcdF (DUF218 family)